MMKRPSSYQSLGEQGAALIIGLMFLIVLSLIGLGAVYTSTLEGRAAGNMRAANEALYLAEAGLERITTDLTYDWTTEGDWGNATLLYCANPDASDLRCKTDTSLGCPPNNCGGNDGTGVITLTDTPKNPPVEDDWTTSTSSYTPVAGTLVAYNGSTAAKNLGTGTYLVQLIRGTGDSEVRVRSTGTTENGTSKTLEGHYVFTNNSVWANALFGGAGMAGALINGNVTVAGSVHVLGTDSTTVALSLSGKATIMDEYANGPNKTLCSETAGADRIPALVSGDPNLDLETKLRIKKGTVDFDGSSGLGRDGNKADGIYVTGCFLPACDPEKPDGWEDSAADDGGRVWADNYTPGDAAPDYDMGDNVNMPSFSDSWVSPDTGTEYATYWEGVTTEGINPTNSVICDISSGSTSSFTCSGAGGDVGCTTTVPPAAPPACPVGDNCLRWDRSTARLTIEGIVTTKSAGCPTSVIDDGDPGTVDPARPTLTIGTATYDGKGSLVATGSALGYAANVKIQGNLLTIDEAGNDDFPKNNALGVLTAGDMLLGGGSQLDMMGLFFAEGFIKQDKQTDIAGSIVTNYFNLGNNVPSICYVPMLRQEVGNISGIIANNVTWKFTTREWREINY